MTGGSGNSVCGGLFETDTRHNFHHGGNKFVEANIACIGSGD
jgi:hypothetical protein